MLSFLTVETEASKLPLPFLFLSLYSFVIWLLTFLFSKGEGDVLSNISSYGSWYGFLLRACEGSCCSPWIAFVFKQTQKDRKGRKKIVCYKFESLRSFLSVKPASALPFLNWLWIMQNVPFDSRVLHPHKYNCVLPQNACSAPDKLLVLLVAWNRLFHFSDYSGAQIVPMESKVRSLVLANVWSKI